MKIDSILLSRIQSTIEKYSLIQSGDRLLLMCSGGPDSTFLLFVLNHLKTKYDFSLSVFHLDHCIREDSYKEKELIGKYCELLKLDLYSFKKNILEISKKLKRSIEEAGRLIRYTLAKEVARRNGYNKLVTAHNLDDLISSFLINLIKKRHYINFFNLRPIMVWGSIPVIRPLVFIPKKLILSNLDDNQVEYILDYTNQDFRYLRNLVNTKASRFVVDLIENYEPIDLFENIFNFCDQYVKSLLEGIEVQNMGQRSFRIRFKDNYCGNFFMVESLFFMIKRIINKPIKLSVVESVLRNQTVTISKGWNLHKVDDKQFVLEYFPYRIKEVIISKRSREEIYDLNDLRVRVKILKKIRDFSEISSFFDEDIKRKIRDNPNYFVIPFCEYLRIRSRREGDYFLPFGLKGKRQKLKKFLIDKKVKSYEKNRCIVFEDSYGIAGVWCYQSNVKRAREIMVDNNESVPKDWFLAELTIL
ncbi:MAG: tRNA lysidine(34) synthetase TilS [bacterium]